MTSIFTLSELSVLSRLIEAELDICEFSLDSNRAVEKHDILKSAQSKIDHLSHQESMDTKEELEHELIWASIHRIEDRYQSLVSRVRSLETEL